MAGKSVLPIVVAGGAAAALLLLGKKKKANGAATKSYPAEPLVVEALCAALAERGETPPLPPLPAADRDLAIRATKLLGLTGNWPPATADSTAKRTWFTSVIKLASKVRSGELTCD